MVKPRSIAAVNVNIYRCELETGDIMINPKYPKINSIFKRGDTGDFIPEYSEPAFEFLSNNEWVGTEKVDGTNIRITVTPLVEGEAAHYDIAGRTNDARIPDNVMLLFETEIKRKLRIDQVLGVFPKFFDMQPITFYGEAYGKGIQSAGKRYRPDGTVGFILFDIKIGQLWLERHNLVSIASEFGLDVAPVVFRGTLHQAIDYISTKPPSLISKTPMPMEGLVLQPSIPLMNRRGDRIITKFKVNDLKKMDLLHAVLGI